MTTADKNGDGAITNGFLRSLGPTSLGRLQPHLEPIDLHRRQVIYAAGQAVDAIYFLNRGLVSMIKPMADGAAVEVGAVGPEGAVCLSAVLGLNEAVLESIVQLAGDGFRMPIQHFRLALDGDHALRRQTIRYAEFALGQMAQTSACNTLHPIEERLCRWLLVAHDGAGTDRFPLTLEFLALMLGVQRPGVSIASSCLQSRGLIAKEKGWITVRDRLGVEASACECYRALQGRLAQVMEPERAAT